MNLVMVLHLLDMNRNSYNTLERRTGLRFMKQNLIEGAGRQRFRFTHVAALGSVLAFQAAGVDARRASEAVSEIFGYVDGVVHSIEQGIESDEHSWLTIINFADGGWGWVGGAENADTFGGGVIESKVSINVRAVWHRMAMRFGQPITVSESDREGAQRVQA